ncbi:DUF3558 domain-containing protein [Actinokineospora sp. UTMC 2448]|uniref:DUF3558 domain-containing protein n=1 Tax=Actinokineospora sp. UTMC 2448 TaxID=2268449 RepID=UPI0021649176|nr:DUF3558 domain-containing protein [Actinokineospora sp. UTMC 2448]
MAGALCLVGGCSPEVGLPVPEPAPESTASVAPVTTPARTRVTTFSVEPPTVSRSLDVRPWAAKVCELVTDEEARAIGVDAHGTANLPDEQGGQCVWRVEGGPSLRVTIYGRQEKVTSLLLGNDHETEYVAEAQVAGQPAIVVSEEKKPSERCTVGVMLAADQSLEVDLLAGSQDTGDVCDRALVTAERAVSKIE